MEGRLLSTLRPSQIYRPEVMEDIHIKAELGRISPMIQAMSLRPDLLGVEPPARVAHAEASAPASVGVTIPP